MKYRASVVFFLLVGSLAAQLDNEFHASAFISKVDLAVPSKARKEFDKANQLAAKQDFAGTIERLHKAIAIYPSYANAYNNLGVSYSRWGDSARSREALEKAISLDNRLAPAYVNLARVNMVSGDFRLQRPF